MSAHAPLSPSASAIWMACPGGAVLNGRDTSPRKSTFAAAEGTCAHDIGFRLLTGATVPDAGTVVEVDGYPVTVDAEMLMHAHAYAGYVRDLGGWQRYEQRVSLEWLVPGVYGTADAIVLDAVSSEIHVVDFKYGAGVFVPVVENWQLLIYALAALGPDNWTDVRRITMHVHQPRMNNVASWTIPEDDVANLHQVLTRCADAIELAEARPLEHLSAGSHCRWCPQRGACPELQSVAVQSAQQVFDPVETLPAATLTAILAQAELIDLWVASVRAEAYRRAETGDMPGWRLVPKRPRRQWADEAAAKALAASIDVDITEPPVVMTPARAETLVGKVKFKALFAPHVVSVSSGLRLAADDGSPVASTDELAGAVFGVLS